MLRSGRARRLGTVLLTAAAVVLGLASCGDTASAQRTEAARKTISDKFPLKVGEKVVQVQLAVLPQEQERGLMFRRDLGRDEGMLFVYARPQQMRFWMRNTPTPLDIGYFDDNGVLLEVYPMQPFDETGAQSRSDRIQFPLEMNQGWFRENGVKPGAKMDLTALGEALKARGFEPRQFGTLAEKIGK